MIYRVTPLASAESLLAAFPTLLANLQEAQKLFDVIESYPEDLSEEEFWQNAETYTDECEAFYNLYEGDIEEFKREKDEDHETSFGSYAKFYQVWLDQNYFNVFLSEKKLLILK